MGVNSDHTVYDDSGAVPWDGQIVTINSKAFIFEDFAPIEGSHFVQSNQVTGAPRGGRDIADVITCSATAQFPSGATLADTPARFTEVTLKHRAVDKVFVITEVGVPQKSGQETKVSLKLREKLTGSGGGSGS